jgi:hypothetical protein
VHGLSLGAPVNRAANVPTLMRVRTKRRSPSQSLPKRGGGGTIPEITFGRGRKN